jgi:hypothetical protein
MKRLVLLPILLLLFAKANAQTSRWMYLSTSTDSAKYMVDTLANDIRQIATYDGHSNIVLIWIKTNYGKSTKNWSLFDSSISHVAIDTTNSQIEITSVTAYKDGNVVNSGTIYPKWTDVIPETMGEAYIRYCQALHNKKLMANLWLNAYSHDLEFSKSDNKKN